MTRPRLVRTSDFPYHVSARTNNKDWFYVPQEQCWNFFSEVLCKLTEIYGVHLHSFVLMSNHCHLTLSTPRLNLDLAMRYLFTEVSRRIAQHSGRINHIFGGRYKSSVMINPMGWAYVYKYVYRNPVRALA